MSTLILPPHTHTHTTPVTSSLREKENRASSGNRWNVPKTLHRASPFSDSSKTIHHPSFNHNLPFNAFAAKEGPFASMRAIRTTYIYSATGSGKIFLFAFCLRSMLEIVRLYVEIHRHRHRWPRTRCTVSGVEPHGRKDPANPSADVSNVTRQPQFGWHIHTYIQPRWGRKQNVLFSSRWWNEWRRKHA